MREHHIEDHQVETDVGVEELGSRLAAVSVSIPLAREGVLHHVAHRGIVLDYEYFRHRLLATLVY